MIEKVNPSHPDKVADRIAGAIVDLAYKTEHDPKIAVEVLIGHGKCHVIIETTAVLDEGAITAAIHRIAGITTCHVKPLHTSEYPTPANRPAYSVLDKTKIKEAYGVEIPHWEASLARCVSLLMAE